MSDFIKKGNYSLEYFRYGSGKKVLLAFHGFGNMATDFDLLEDIIGKNFTVLSVNLFFHGKSYADKSLIERGFGNDDLDGIIRELFLRYPSDKYSLLGYSMGGRFVLKTLELFPEKIDKAILLAPDGIEISPLYLFLTQNRLGHQLLNKAVYNPGAFFRIAGFLRRTRMIGEKKYRFGMGNFDTEQKRKKVYQVWMVYRKISSKRDDILAILKNFNIHLYLFYGHHDKIIPPSIGERFQKKLKEKISLHILDAGHKLIKKDLLREVALKSGLLS